MTDKAIRILLIEDNPGDVRLIGEMLSEVKGTSITMNSVSRLSAGLEFLGKQKVDVVLLDLGLPDSQGLETLSKVQAQKSGIPIVILTALNDESLAMKAMRQGAQDYLVKWDVQSKDLWRAIHYSIERKLTEEKLRLSEQRLKEAEAIGRIGHWEFDFETRIIEWSDEVYELYERDKSLGPPSEEEEALYYAPEEARRLREFARLARESGKEFRYDLVARLPSGRAAYFNASMSPVKDEKGRTIKLFGTVQDITERKQAENSLHEANDRYRALFDRSLDCIYVHDLEGNFLDANDAALNLIGYTREDMPNLSFLKLLAPDQLSIAQKVIKEICRTGHDERPTEYRVKTRNGEFRQIETKGVMLYRDGQTFAIQGIARDITERKQVEEALRTSLQEKEALLKEIHHRVKNNMQIISSLLNLQARQIQDRSIMEIFKECQNRIRSMALVHEKLYRSQDLSRIDFSEYIQDLVIHLFSSYHVDSSLVQFIPEMDRIYLNINTANPCALLVNELVSNALKHAFSEKRMGEIHINLSSVEDHKFKLLVRDNGIGFPRNLDFRKSETLGMQMVMMLVNQLDGTIELNNKAGTEFKIIFNELKYKSRY